MLYYNTVTFFATMFLIRSRPISKDSVKISFDTESVSLDMSIVSFDTNRYFSIHVYLSIVSSYLSIRSRYLSIMLTQTLLTHGGIMAQRLPLIRWRLIRFYDKHLYASQVMAAMRPLHNCYQASQPLLTRQRNRMVTRAPAILFYRLATIIWT